MRLVYLASVGTAAWLGLAASGLTGCGNTPPAAIAPKTNMAAAAAKAPLAEDAQTNACATETNSLFHTNLRNVRDPFFPESQRISAATPERSIAAAKKEPLGFRLKGISGPAGHRLALINNQTFAVGEPSRVRSLQGQQVTVRCLEIGEYSVKVLIEGEAAPRELLLNAP